MEQFRIVEQIQNKFGELILETCEHRGQTTLRVNRNSIIEIVSFLKNDLRMNHLSCLCGVDNLKRNAEYIERFEVVYQFYSIENRVTIRIKAQIPESDPSIASITGLWTGANWLERETYDMFGIEFTNHPNLKRILTPTGLEGYPLLKEYALRGDTEWKGLVELREKFAELRQFDFYNSEPEPEPEAEQGASSDD